MGSSASLTSGANKYLQYLRNISKYIFQVWSSLANLRRTWGCDVVLCVWIKYDVYPRPLSDQPSNPQSSPCSHLRGGISLSLSLCLSLPLSISGGQNGGRTLRALRTLCSLGSLNSPGGNKSIPAATVSRGGERRGGRNILTTTSTDHSFFPSLVWDDRSDHWRPGRPFWTVQSMF